MLGGLPFSSIEEEEANWLDRGFTNEEVFDAVKNMSGDKALVTNDFSMVFF